MSSISEQVEELHTVAFDRLGELRKLISDAAETIEMLSAKLSECQAEKAAMYFHGDWIPVNERPPEELVEVNITYKNNDPTPYYEFVRGHPFTGSGVYYRGKWYWASSVCIDYLGEFGFNPNPADNMSDGIEVTAWRPLPEPYKGGEE